MIQRENNTTRYGEHGFTLIELLVVILVLIVVGGIVVAILVSSLRGSAKTNAYNELQKNGDYAVSQMAKIIRNAHDFNSVTDTTTDPPTVHTTCNAAPNTDTYSSVEITDFGDKVNTFACCPIAGKDTYAIAWNPDTQPSDTIANTCVPAHYIVNAGITIPTCSFTCQQDTYSAPNIGISFTLQQGVDTNYAAIPFHTSVLLRNYFPQN